MNMTLMGLNKAEREWVWPALFTDQLSTALLLFNEIIKMESGKLKENRIW